MADSHQAIFTFALAAGAGVLLMSLAVRLRLSAIVLLLLGGVALGPQGLGLVQPASLGQGLDTIIKLTVALILFEGGLTLDPNGYRQVAREIRGVLTRGVLITWLCSALAIYALFGYDPSFCLLAGSLIIVTGPTVIAPLLKRIRVKKTIHHILHWEGVLIDPIGVFVALLCYEWILGDGAGALRDFVLRFATGLVVGLVCGLLISLAIRRGLVPEERLNTVAVASTLVVFALADHILPESGLLSVTVAGLVVGYRNHPRIEALKVYKAELIEMLIGILFVLLSANLDLQAFVELGWRGVALVAIVMLVIRPLNIWGSMYGTSLGLREKLFLSWIGPRGIVAASMASLFALNLRSHLPHAAFLETFTFSVIAGTVLVQGLTAGWVGRLLGMVEAQPRGWLIVGAHGLGRAVGGFLRQRGEAVVLMDSNPREVALARRAGLTAVRGNALLASSLDTPELYGTGYVLAITSNPGLNALVCQHWKREQPGARLYRWGTLAADQEAAAREDFAGQEVWRGLDMADIARRDPEARDLSLRTRRLEPGEKSEQPERVLMLTDKSGSTPGWHAHAGAAWTLSYFPFSVRLDARLRPEWLLLIPQGDLGAVTRQLLECLRPDYPELDVDGLHGQLLAMAREHSCVMGEGVAMPHLYSEALEDSVVLVAKLGQPACGEHAGEQFEVVFLVLSPRDKPSRHLHTLAEISRFVMNANYFRQLRAARTREELVAVFYPDRPLPSP